MVKIKNILENIFNSGLSFQILVLIGVSIVKYDNIKQLLLFYFHMKIVRISMDISACHHADSRDCLFIDWSYVLFVKNLCFF